MHICYLSVIELSGLHMHCSRFWLGASTSLALVLESTAFEPRLLAGNGE